MISERWESELYAYIAGIVKRNNGQVVIINGMSDHVHLLIILKPCDLPAFMRELKASSSRWAKQHNAKFVWQRRYGAFTVSESAIEKVRDYIRDQKTHPAKRTFDQEYAGILRNHGAEFDERYLWN